MSARNGNGLSPAEPKNEQEAERELTGRPLTLDYRPTRGLWGLGGGDGRFHYHRMLADVEDMVVHPDVSLPYSQYMAGAAKVKFNVKARNKEEYEEAKGILEKFWALAYDQACLRMDYGWYGGELSYKVEKGLLKWSGLEDCLPLDCRALAKRGRQVGFSVKGNLSADAAGGGAGAILLRTASPRWPAKGLWLTHNRRWDRFYGRSQLVGAWRPWKRLASRGGAEEIVDGAVTRRSYGGPEVRYPSSAFRRKGGGEGDFESARAYAREIAENAKSGVSFALPNDRDKDGNYLWEVNWPELGLAGMEVVFTHEGNLQTQIARGIGTPPELLEASETGSGWSGRKVPLLGFYQGQLKNARSLCRALVEQLVLPVLRWNHGPEARCEVEVELDLPADVSGEKPEPEQGAVPARPPPAAAEARQSAPEQPPSGVEQLLPAGGAQLSREADRSPYEAVYAVCRRRAGEGGFELARLHDEQDFGWRPAPAGSKSRHKWVRRTKGRLEYSDAPQRPAEGKPAAAPKAAGAKPPPLPPSRPVATAAAPPAKKAAQPPPLPRPKAPAAPRPAAPSPKPASPARPPEPKPPAPAAAPAKSAVPASPRDALPPEKRQALERLEALNKQAVADPSHPLVRLKAQVAEVSFGDGSKVRTIRGTKESPLTAEDHEALDASHSRAAAMLNVYGRAEEANAQLTAAKAHRAAAEAKDKAAGMTPAKKAHVERLTASLATTEGLTDADRKTRKAHMKYIFSRMPDAVADRVAGEVHESVHFATSEALAAYVGRVSGKPVHDGVKPMGAWSQKSRLLMLDGQANLGQKIGTHFKDQDADTIRGTAAHELAHTLDYTAEGGGQHSKSPEWLAAFQEEITRPDPKTGTYPLSKYATTKPSEGWAEFGRLVYGTKIDREKLKARMPKCAAYWEKHGYLP